MGTPLVMNKWCNYVLDTVSEVSSLMGVTLTNTLDYSILHHLFVSTHFLDTSTGDQGSTKITSKGSEKSSMCSGSVYV